jgi:Patatin-like phospholipase
VSLFVAAAERLDTNGRGESLTTVPSLRRRVRSAIPIVRLTSRPLREWVVRYAFLAAVCFLLLGILANAFFWPFGVPYLFWQESWGRRLFAGIGVGMFTVNVGVVGFLLASRQPWITELEAVWSEWEPKDYVLGFLVRYLLLTTAVLVTAVWLFALRAPAYLSGPARLGFPASVTLGAAAAAGSLWLTRSITEGHVRRGTAFGRLLLALDRGPSTSPPSPVTSAPPATPRAQIPIDGIHRAAAVFFIGQAVFFVACGIAAVTFLGAIMSAGLVLAMFLSALVSGYGAVRWWAEDDRFLWFFGIIGGWITLAGAGPYRHTLFDLRNEYRDPVPITVRPPPNHELLDSATTIESWAAGGRSGPLVVLAVDGGGIRAATWIIAMLSALEKDLPGFPHHVRIITGASGGMVGAAYYVATLERPDPARTSARHATEKGDVLTPEAMIAAISKDSLEATTRRLFFRDISPVVWQSYADRGYALEHQWELNTGSMSQPLHALAAGEAAGWRPSLVFSPMIVEDGRRLLIANLDLAAVSSAVLPQSAPTPRTVSVSALELAKLVPAARNLHVSTVARMSASFPYVTPAAEIPTRPLRRVVDAGYYDEHGVALAASWILANRDAIRRHATKLALIQFPDERSDPRRLPNPCAGAWWSRGLSDLFSPPEGVLAGWSGAMAFRNDEAVQALGHVFNNQEQADFFRSYVFEPYDPVPVPAALYVDTAEWLACARRYCADVEKQRPVALSWTMIEDHRQELRGSPNTALNCAARRDLVRWWTGAEPGTLQGCRAPMPEPTPGPPDTCAVGSP